MEKNNDYARNIVLQQINGMQPQMSLKLRPDNGRYVNQKGRKGHIINPIQNTGKKISLRKGARKGK